MPEKRIASDDRPWRFVLSLNWELPLGRGRAIAEGDGFGCRKGGGPGVRRSGDILDDALTEDNRFHE